MIVLTSNDEAGFLFRAPAELPGGWKFSSFSITEEWEQDEAGKNMAEAYQQVKLLYTKQLLPGLAGKTKVTLRAMEEVPEPSVTYLKTEEINGIPVYFNDYVLKLVAADYVMTDEDWEYEKSGKGSFSCDGETIGESHCYSAYWIENGVMYHIDFDKPDMAADKMREMIETVMEADIQKAASR